MQIDTARLQLAIYREDWGGAARIMLDHFNLSDHVEIYSYNVSPGSSHGPDIVMCLHSGRVIGWSKPTGWWDLKFVALGDRGVFRARL